MKRRRLPFYIGFCLLTFSSLSLFAYHGEDENPFEFDANGIIVADQSVKKQEDGAFQTDILAGSSVQFGEVHAGVTYHFLCSGCCEEYLIGAGYTYTRMHWGQNPFFKQDNFNAATLDLGAKWGCLCDWDINVFMRTYLDTDSPNVAHYLWFDVMGWARLRHRENLGIHVGTLVFTGMKINRMYPIFGFDWHPDDCSTRWQVNMVYPVDMNISYQITDFFTGSIGARLIYSRHRVMRQDDYEDFDPFELDQGLEQSHATQYFDFGDIEVPTDTPFPPEAFPNYLNPRSFARALWEYRAWGIEANVAYNCHGTIVGNIFVGWSFNNHLTIGAHSWNHKQTYKLKAAPYVGADFMFRF